MRKKIVVYLGMVLLALLVTVLAAWSVPPSEPKLRVGMSQAEVNQAMGGFPEGPVYATTYIYRCRPGWLGDTDFVFVEFDAENTLVWWFTAEPTCTRPPWLDWAGW